MERSQIEPGEGIKSVSEDIGYSRANIYSWRKKYLQGGATALMNDKNVKPNTLTEGAGTSTSELGQLQDQIRDMQMESLWIVLMACFPAGQFAQPRILCG